MTVAEQVQCANRLLQGDPLSQLLGYQILERLRSEIAAVRAAAAEAVDGDAQFHFAAEAEQQLPGGWRIVPAAQWSAHYAR